MLKSWVIGKDTAEVLWFPKCSLPGVQDVNIEASLPMLTTITWLRWCLPGSSTVNLLFSLCNYYVFGDRHSETMQISYLDLNFCVRLLKTWSSVGMRLKPLRSLKLPPSSKERSSWVILQACFEGLQFPFHLPLPPPRNCSYCLISLVNIPKKNACYIYLAFHCVL